jgi:hypothetical protein
MDCADYRQDFLPDLTKELPTVEPCIAARAPSNSVVMVRPAQAWEFLENDPRAIRAMEMPQIRPGKVTSTGPMSRVVAFFYNTAEGNSAIQLLTTMGIPNDQLGVTPPERIETGQGMILSIPCPDERMVSKVEAVCRGHGAEIHRQSR